MRHNKKTEFVMYVDNFLSKETLESLQNNLVNLEYKLIKNNNGQIYGYRHTFPKSFHNDALLKLIKNRALFFNGSKILHSDLQSFGDSSSRYTLNIFYKDE
jgi:hypothetical protein